MVRVTFDGHEYKVGGRVAQIIRWLIERQHLIAMGHKAVHFVCRGKTVLPSIEEYESLLTE